MIEAYVIVGAIVIGSMFYGYLTGTPLPTLFTGFITEDLATYNCQISGHSGCLDNPNSKTCMSGYQDNGAGTCVLIKYSNPPQSTIGTSACPYGTVKDSNGQCVSATASTGSCGTGQTYVGGYCVDNGIAKYGEVPASSANTPINPATGKPTQCVYTFNLVAMALTGTPTVCNPLGGDTSKALQDFNNDIHACAVGYHWASNLLTGQCVKNDAPTGSGVGQAAVNTCPDGYYMNQTSQMCTPSSNTQAPGGTIGTTTSVCSTDASGNCATTQTSPFGTGGGGGTGSSDNLAVLAQAINNYADAIKTNQNTVSKPDGITTFITQNPFTVMFIVVAIMAMVIVPKLIKKK